MAVPSRIATSTGVNTGSNTYTITPPPGIQDGDLWIVDVLSGSASAYTTDHLAKNWWALAGIAVNTRSFVSLARIYNSADPVSAYTLTTNASAYTRWASVIVRNHGVTQKSDIVIGSTWRRQENGGSQALVVAPSITTPGADYLALALMGEATTATGSWTATSGDFALWVEGVENSTAIEWVVISYKNMPTAGDTGVQSITYAGGSLNGVGVQIAIPPAATPPVTEPGEFSYSKGAGFSQFSAGTTARTVNLAYPADAVLVNDVLVAAFVLLDDANATVSTPSGWTLVKSTTSFGTARLYVFTKRRASGQTETSQDFTVTGSASVAATIYRLRNVTTQGMIVGADWFRSGSGETTRNRALSVTTVDPYSVVLAISADRTNADEAAGWANAITNGMTIIDQFGSGSAWNNNSANSLVVAYKKMDTPGASGDTYIPYTNAHASNGYAFHLVLKREGAATTPPPATGRIGMHAPVNPSSDSISVGLDKLGGTTVEVALMSPDGQTQIERKTVSADPTTGWANATFTGLESASYYRVWFYVDGVLQTDAALILRTLPVGTASYTVVAGSCQFTGSNHPVFDRIREENPIFVAHMGDLHYADATTEAAWRAGHEASFAAARFKQLFETTFISWAPDNHDRIITNPTGTGTGLNLGETDPQTAIEWKYFAGQTGWSSPDTLGRTWVAGRVRYIQTDAWSVRDDGDGDPAPRTFLGAAQKAWFKNVLATAQEPLIIWFAQWTATNHANGRWNSFPEESSELEAFINARPDLKRRMIMIGGDSHSLQADDGSRVPGNHRFAGIPNLNISGFNRSSDSGDGQSFWTIANAPLRAVGQLESEIGGYSRITINDDGMHIRFLWEGIRVNAAGQTDRVAFYTRSYGSTFDRVYLADIPVSSLNIGDKTLWQEPYYGATI